MNDINFPINVSINKSKEVVELVPEDASRAKVHAWLDIISPITEWAGLKGDALRHKRELLRLEQEASLASLGQKLKQRLDGESITPISSKVLIPSLEMASLESPDSEMIDRWANLLATEALNPSDDTRTCASILGELGNNEAAILDLIQKRLIENNLWDDEKISQRYSQIRGFMKENYAEIQSVLGRHVTGKITNAQMNEHLRPVIDRSPVWIHSFRLSKGSGDANTMSLPFTEDQRVALDILEYRNLLRKQEYMEILGKEPLVTLGWFDLTNLGIRFLKKVSSPLNKVARMAD
jgi:hypothetical protein